MLHFGKPKVTLDVSITNFFEKTTSIGIGLRRDIKIENVRMPLLAFALLPQFS